MSFGEDLNLGMLDADASFEQDFVINSGADGLSQDLDSIVADGKPETIVEALEKPLDENFTGEEDITPESVAGEEGNKKETPDATTSSPKSDGKTSKLYSSLAAELHQTGVLPSLEDSTKIDSWEKLQEAVKKEIENGLSENEKAYRAAIERGEPEDVYVKFKKTDDDLNSISDERLENPEEVQLRFNILAQDYINKGFDREEAIKHAKRSQDLNEDIEDSKKAIDRLIDYNRTSYKNIIEAQRTEQDQSVSKVKAFIDTTNEIIKGVTLTQGVKEQLVNQMTKAVGMGKNGKPVTAYGKALSEDTLRVRTITEYLFLATKGFKDFSKLTNVIETKALSNFDDVLKRSDSGFMNNGRSADIDQSNFLMGDDLKLDI